MKLKKLNILIVEPFYSGSHKSWIDGYCKTSSHNIEVVSIPGRFWKWRMHGGAIKLAEECSGKLNPDYILTTDMLNLPVFLSILKPKCPVGIYFHENLRRHIYRE